MRIRILAIGNKMPDFVKEGCETYLKRLRVYYPLELIEIPAAKRTKSTSTETIIQTESENLFAATKPAHRRVVLDVNGEMWSTLHFSNYFKAWLQETNPIDFLIGGPDGLSLSCINQAQTKWSLSPLTLPHPLVRILVLEQIYRVASLMHNHPYHR